MKTQTWAEQTEIWSNGTSRWEVNCSCGRKYRYEGITAEDAKWIVAEHEAEHEAEREAELAGVADPWNYEGASETQYHSGT